MEISSKIPFSKNIINQTFEYQAKALAGSAQVRVVVYKNDRDQILFHLMNEAKALGFQYHFESMSKWNIENGYLDFYSYEEKDFSKQIKKKWEPSSSGLNYIENKKGLVLEREVIYFEDKKRSNIYDPLSAILQLTINPIANGESREISIFGKQKILDANLKNINGEIQVEPIYGFNPVWTNLLLDSKIKIENELIQAITFKAPMGFGQIKAELVSATNEVGEDSIQKIKVFESDSFR